MTVNARNLEKSFGNNEVLRGLDFHLNPHEIHALIGRNGTGKTTLLAILAGQLRYSGEISVFDAEPFDNRQVMDRVVFTGVDTAYPKDWSIASILNVAAQRYPKWNHDIEKRILESFDLDTGRKFGEASRGQRSMVAATVGLAAQCELTLLDEPYLGLDAINREKFYRLLMEEQRRNPRTVVVATHHLEESAQFMDRFLFLSQEGMLSGNHSAEELEEAFVVIDDAAEDIIQQAVFSKRLGNKTRCIVPAGSAQGRPLPLDQAARIMLGDSDVEF